MHIRRALSMTALLLATALAGQAQAATTATATTPLNIRSGPGPQYDVVGVIKSNGQAVVNGCLEGSLWCQVSYDGRQGWAYSQYLAMTVAARPWSSRSNRPPSRL